MKFKKAVALTVSVLLSFMNMSNIVMAEEQQPITNGKQRINANMLEWTPVSAENQLGGADDFSGILFNELKNFNETGGPIAAGSINNVKIITFEANTSPGINQFSDIVIPKFNVGVMAQKEVNNSGKTVISNGDAVIGDSVDSQKLDPRVGNIYKRQSEVDKFLEDAKADLIKLNNDLWGTEETAKTLYDGNTAVLNCVKGINIFDVDLTSGRKNIQFNYPEDAKDCTIIIKYKGNIINYGETFIGNTLFYNKNIDELANRVIWTFDPSLKEVKIDRTIVNGSILAPNANITFASAGYSAINGTIIANGLDGSGSSSELHWVGPFKGDIITPIEKTGSFKFNKKDNHGNSISGATFALYQGAEVKYTSTSTNNVSFNNIKQGTYILKETSAPNGYEISKSEVEVIVSNNGLVTFKENGVIKTEADLDLLYVNNISKVDFNFNKVVAGTKIGIPNVEFKLVQGDKVIATAVSDTNGAVTFKGIEVGSYTLVETTPTGYKAAGPWTIDVTENGAILDGKNLTQIDNVENTGSFQFNKKDNHGNVVKGAEFALYKDGEAKYTATSTDIVSFNNIKQGTYILKETSAPNGYEISKVEIEVTVDSEGKATFKVNGEDKNLSDLDLLYINNISTSDFSFNKVISGTKTGIPNVEFKLIQGEKEIATAISDKNGVVSFKNIELGTYTLVEKTPFGYKAAGPWTIDVTKNGAILDGKNLIQIENAEVMGSFQFNKQDNHGNEVKGATFALYQEDTVKYSATSTEAGVVSFNDIKEGSYRLKETSAPSGYEISKSIIEVIVNNDGTMTFKENGVVKTEADLDTLYVNNVSKFDFSFNKVLSGTTKGIPDVEFKLVQGDKLVATAVSDENGTVTFKGIELGSYTLVETTPTGYKAAGPWNINITKNGAILDGKKLVKIENVEVIGAFQFNKLDNHGNPVKGAEFALYQDGEVKYTATSTGNLSLKNIFALYKFITRGDAEISKGEVSFSGIKQGTYILKETSAPNGYEISKAEIEVTVDSDGTVTFKENGEDKNLSDLDLLYVNNVSTVDFSFNKVVSGTDTGIPNVEFKLMKGDKKIATAISDEKGIVTFNGIELGSYTLVETTPFGYKAAGPWTVNVTKEGAIINGTKLVQIENIEVIGSFDFNKLDNHERAVKEARFALFQDGVEKYTATSTDTGLVSFSGIKEGTYILKETSAPNGYEISKAVVEVTVSNDGSVTFKLNDEEKSSGDLNAVFINKVSTADFSFNKVVSGTDTGIPNVEFKLMQDDDEIATSVSNESGIVSFKNIELGSYTLVEKTPFGYKAAGPWTVNVTKEGVIINGTKLVQIENIEVIGSFEFNKLDNHEKVVKEARFALLQDGVEKYTATSTDTGLVSFSGIKEGTYILKETSAPNGYEISKAVVEVTVSNDGSITFKLNDEEKRVGDLNTIFINKISTADFRFNKVVSGTDTGIPNVEFKLMQGDNEIATSVSNESGVVSFKNIELGSYTLVEKTPFGYKAAGPWTVNVTKEGAFIGETKLDKIENIEVIGSFEFNKLDNHEKAVKEARFALLQDGVEKYAATSTDTGLVSFNDVKEGTYILKETSAPNGHEISKVVVEVTVSNDGAVTFKLNDEEKSDGDLNAVFINKVSTADFSFNKVVSGTDTGIPNVEFKLMQGDDEIATAVSNESGVVSFKNIELGSYTLVEKTPFGYKAAGPWTVNVTKEGAFIGETKLDKIENVEVIGSFQFNKLDNHKNVVKGAEFALYQDEEVKYTATSIDTGLVSFNNVKEGTYILKETNAPNGYEISKAEVEVTVNSDGTVTFKESGVVKTVADLELLYINKMILGSINFTKYINDKKGILSGAEFELLINGERYGSTVFSDANGLVTFLNVKPGEYKIREVSSHSNYFKTSDKIVDVVIDDKGVSSLVGQAKIEAETIFINTIENSIQFIKYSDSKSTLSNATFELLEGTEVKMTSISDKNGVVRFDNILPGEYIVREKSAPNGYIKSEATRKLVVKDNGEILITASEIKDWEEAFKNKKVVGPKEENTDKKEQITTPKTSDDANIIFPLLTAMLSLAGIVLIKRVKH